MANTILSKSAVVREEIDLDGGLVAGTETVIGMTYCYSNQFNGIRIVGNFVKVGTDIDGVEFFINRWQDVEIPMFSTHNSSVTDGRNISDRITYERAISEAGASFVNVRSIELVYAHNPDIFGDGIFRLCWQIDASVTYYVDCKTGQYWFAAQSEE